MVETVERNVYWRRLTADVHIDKVEVVGGMSTGVDNTFLSCS